MKVDIRESGAAAVAELAGRLDAKGAGEAESALSGLGSHSTVVLDCARMDYLSSAGVRVFLSLHKALGLRGRRLFLAALQPYCREVIRISGLEDVLVLVENVEEALASCRPDPKGWETPCGRFTFHEGSAEATAVEVTGDIEDVLNCRVDVGKVRARQFSAKEYSIGLGGLGPDPSGVLPVMGEMITIGGTMVWLPTDGNDTPDFLVPREDSQSVRILTGFNVSLSGGFNEYAEFESKPGGGATIAEVYRGLFDLARERRPDYRGALGLAMRAELGAVYGSGVRKAPVAGMGPANGLPITDASNFFSWFEYDDAPRLRDVTGLICGVGLDLDADLSVFDRGQLGATFYLNPANPVSSREMLHNHGVFFTPQPLGEKPLQLENEIQRVVDLGDFVDMRHLLDRTAVVWALIGISYVQEFRADRSA
ncbi:MAG: hypothetical protein Fur0032_06640 [Terrimicrobiaceae bacterium]